VQRRSGPVSAPEGDGQRRRVVESETDPLQPIVDSLPDNPDSDVDLRTRNSGDDNDADPLSLLSLPEEVDANQFQLPDNADDDVPELEDHLDSEDEDEDADGGPDSAMPQRR